MGGFAAAWLVDFTPFVLMKEMYIFVKILIISFFSGTYLCLLRDFMLCYNRNTASWDQQLPHSFEMASAL